MTSDKTSRTGQSPHRSDAEWLKLSQTFLALAICWTLIIALMTGWQHRQAHSMALELARTEAVSTFNKDLAYRKWANSHGGVYAPVTGKTPPNPYLAHIPERDITTPSGKKLTLINPAYMTRQVYDAAKEQYGVQGHITSLKTLRPENAPDAWEAKALQAFEAGSKEVYSLEMLGSMAFMRLMRPMIADEGCLKCHGHQGYKVGDVRGGISVSVPWKPYHDMTLTRLNSLYWASGLVWVLGIGGLWFMRNRLRNKLLQQAQTEETLAERNQFIASIVNLSPDVLYIYDLIARKNIYVNEGFQRILGYANDEVQHMGDQLLGALMHPDDLTRYVKEILPRYTEVHGDELINHQFRMKHKNGQWHWLDCSERIYKRGPQGEPLQVLGVVHDVTAKKNTEERLVQSLREKDVMLKEIHHRVKNNMQVIVSLLNLSARSIEDPSVRALFEESRNRINTMALIHENLYRSQDLAHIDFKEYLQSLIASIADLYKRHNVACILDMEPISLDVNTGIPCGLIINELVANCFKHAFPGGRTGEVRLGVSRNNEGTITLFVQDNGVGFPATVDFRNTASLGLQLVTVLAGQIHGTIELVADAGTKFTVTFPGKQDQSPG